MPDVGILNLQIHDDSAKAAEGLSKLVAKLGEMKNATSKIRLGTVATGIKRINDELSKVQPSAIYKLKQLADVLEKIGSISGNVGGIRISFGGKGQSAEEINACMQAAREAAAQTSSMFESIGQRIQEDVTGVRGFAGEVEKLNNLVQQTGWTAQATAEQFAQMFQVANSIRMSGALSGGASSFALGDGTGGSGAQWVEWKDGAIEVEGTVTEAMDAIRIGANDAIIPISGIVESASEMTSSFETVESSVQNISSNADQIKSMATGFEDVAKSTRDAARETANYYKSLEDAFYGIRNGQKIENDLMSKWLHGEGTENEKLYAIKTMATQFGMSTDDVRAKIAELMAAENGLTGAAQETTDAMNSINGAADEQKKSLKELIIGANGLNGAFKRMFPTLSGLLGRFSQLVKYRMLRAVIKQISEGFREGTENYYRYSQAIGGEFATKMDNAATALLQMKNSIGAAAAPLINSLIPYLQMAVDWFINIVNYANQFVALLRGQATWSRAVPKATKAFEDQTKAAKKAGSAVKDLLADWDELNIIQSESGGGSGAAGASAAEDYLNMFEEVGKYENWVKDLVDNIKGQFGDIWGLVKRIGIAVLGWKVSSAFAGILGTIGMLIGAGAIIDIVFNITQLLDNQYFKTGDIGWVITDVLQTAIGAYLANKVVKNVIGKGAGKVTAGITLAVSAVADIIALAGATDVEALSTEGIITSIKSGLKLGAGFYLLENFAGVHGMKAFAGAGEIASIGIGAAIGIKAIATYADTGELTLDRIKELLTGVTIAGVGVTLFELTSGAGIAAAVTSGGAVALGLGLVFAAAIGVVAVARLLDQDDSIQWGNYNATQAEIEAWAKEQGFKANVSANLTLLNNTVDILPEERKKIEEDAAALIPTLQVIKYGLATEKTYTKLKEELFGTDGNGGVIGRVKTYAEEQKTLIQTSFTFAPIVDEKGVVDQEATSEFLKAGTAGWGEVEAYMGRIGTQLADALKGNTINGIKTFDDELILELTNKLSNVQRALSQSQISSGALGGMMTDLSGLTKESFSNAVNVWDDYKNQLRDKYSAMLQEELTSFRSLAAFYAARGEEGDAELAKYYADQADRLVEMWDKRLEYAIWDMAEPGREMFRKAILKMLDFEVTNDDITSALADSGYANYDMGNFIASMFDTKGNINDTAGERFDKYLQDILKTVFPKNYDVIKQLMDSGALNYADLIPKEMISGIADGFLGEHPELTQAWNDFIDGFYKEIQLENPATEIEHDIVITENVTTESEYETTGMGAEENPAVAAAQETIAGIEGIVAEANNGTTLALDDMTFDTTDMQTSASNAAWAIEDMARRMRAAFQSLDGLGFTFSAGNAEEVVSKMNAAIHVSVPAAASGAVFKSGDIFSANENGQAELIGSYGNKTAVMNNDQVVGAVTNGVAQANSGVESRLSAIENLLIRLMNKELVAKVVPSSAMGRSNQMSADAYDRVRG